MLKHYETDEINASKGWLKGNLTVIVEDGEKTKVGG